MSHPDAKRWDARYTAEGEDWLERPPRQLLQDFSHLLPDRGLALDAASGVANNGLFLAHRGLRVIALDVSEVALRLAMRRAKAQSLLFSAVVYDLVSSWLPSEYFDVIVNFRFLERATFPVYRQALKPGGLLFFETFLKTEAEPDHPAYYLEPGELRQVFEDFELLYWKEGVNVGGEKEIAQLVARKPFV